MTLAFIAGLNTGASLLLMFCVLAICVFEAINGFHDTANAVATVIYTKALKPKWAVIWSGFCNFLGAWLGGITVAMGIIKLMPLNDLMAMPLNENVALVFAILIAAISWNLGTWYFGIPCSSSHTLIGALLGAGFAFWSVHGGAGINWDKAKEIGLSLLISPLFGFSLAILLMFTLRSTIKKKKRIFNEPDDKQAPPPWIRAILISTCTLVSYFHGNNDGQKGVGLLLVVMLAFLPMHFAVNPEANNTVLKTSVTNIQNSVTAADFANNENAKSIAAKCVALNARLDTVNRSDKKSLFALRKDLQGLNKSIESGLKDEHIAATSVAKVLKTESASLANSYEFSPWWIVLLIAICLGTGTMFGWKRIVVTIGEKIGKNHLTYAQGASAELCAAATIGVSSYFGLPVSTTHVLSSGVAGTMVAHGGVQNLQTKTIKNIALAWVLTLPVTMTISALLFLLFRLFV